MCKISHLPKTLCVAALLALAPLNISAQDKEVAPVVPSAEILNRQFGSHDRAQFSKPDKVFYPETWFHFIGGNVSYEGITADLEAIAAAGISGVHFFHGQQGGKWPATGEDIECMSEKWEDAVKFVAEESKRLGLRFTVQNCPGWAMSGGPWIKPENAMRILVSSTQIVKGGDKISTSLAQPQPSGEEWRDYRDIAVLAFPTPAGEADSRPTPKSVVGNGSYDWQKPVVMNQNITLSPALDKTNWVEVSYDKPTVIRTLQLSSVQGFNHNMCYDPGVNIRLYAYTADGNRVKVLDAPMPQSNWQDGSTMSLACRVVDEVVKYRVEIENQYNMNVSRIGLYSKAMKNSWESEACWTLRAPERTGDDLTQPAEAYIKSDQILDVSKNMTSDGSFEWQAPNSGDWTILRLGHVNAGRKNAPAPPSGTGWECDKLSTEGPEAHFEGYVGMLKDGALKGDLLQGMLLDSWECNTQTWTVKMEQEFERVTGYELREWLPAVIGYVIDDPETTSRFLLDWRTTIGDLYANKFYRRMAELGHERGLSVMYETAAGDVFPADILEYFKYADVPMCEFWHPFSNGYVGDLNFKPIKPTASAARIYGKPRVNAESFTSFNLTWDEHWQMLKEVADFNAVEGVTHNVFHTYTHNPHIDYLKPGTSFGARIGTPFLRGQTWWPHMREFTTYLARCSYMLERGRAVSDVLWYLGDEISHKPSQKDSFPEGYRFDYCNSDVLLNRLSVKNGKLVTPEGYSYSMMWIPDNKRMLPETLEKLYELIKQGAVVVASAPKGLATLRGDKMAQKRFDRAVSAIWGKMPEEGVKRIGNGAILSGVELEEAFKMLGMQPDVKGDVRWIHRSVDGADIYFVTPQVGHSFDGQVLFRAKGNVEIWNPITGSATSVKSFTEGEYTVVDLSLPESGSCFVVIHDDEPQPYVEKFEIAQEKPIGGEWTLSFPEGWDVPAQVKVKELKAWKDLDFSAEGKAFSGSVKYSTKFVADKADVQSGGVKLDLGKVDMIATVKLNGKALATLWCAPYSLDISKAIVEGENELEIEVTSTWFNRLVYDAAQPESERKTWTISGPSANNALRESGLMGPVKLVFGKK